MPTPVFHSDFDFATTTRRGEGSRGVVVRPQFGGGLPKASNKDRSNDTANSKARVLAKRPPPFSLAGIGKPKPASDNDASLVRASALSLAFASPAKERAREEARESNTSRMLHNPPTTTTRKPSNVSVPLKPVPIPPPLPLPAPLPTPSKMKTISTTRVALATDPRTESGSSELFSLFLRHQNQNLGGKVYGDSVERELGRGLEVSPEKAKAGREGRGRFVRCVLIRIIIVV